VIILERFVNIAFVDPYISLANDEDSEKISYDIKVLDKDVDVEDIFRWRVGT